MLPVVIDPGGTRRVVTIAEALYYLGVDVRVLDYAEHAMTTGQDSRAAAYVECAIGERVLWGVGLHNSIVRASISAILSAVNRAERDRAGSAEPGERISRPGGGP